MQKPRPLATVRSGARFLYQIINEHIQSFMLTLLYLLESKYERKYIHFTSEQNLKKNAYFCDFLDFLQLHQKMMFFPPKIDFFTKIQICL